LRLFEIRVMLRMFGSKREKMTGCGKVAKRGALYE
jgi:hypothetical protein